MDRVCKDLLDNLENRSNEENFDIFCSLDKQHKIEVLDQVNDYYGFMFVSNLQSKVIMVELLCEVKSDNLKIKCVNDIKFNDYDRVDILCSLESDNLKIKYLNELDEVSKIEIICSLKSDELKCRYIDNYSDNFDDDVAYSSGHAEKYFDKNSIICSLKSDELKLKYFNDFGDSEILCSLGSDDLKLKYFNELYDDYSKVSVIESLKSDILKEKYLNTITLENGYDELDIDYLKSVVIKSFASDELKVKYLENFDLDGVYIVCSLKSDDLKLKYLDSFDDSAGLKRLKIICNFASDELKLKFLDDYNKAGKAEIICSLKSDELKIKNLPKFYGKLKEKIVLSLSSTEKLFDYLQKSNNSELINSLLFSSSSEKQYVVIIDLLFMKDKDYSPELIEKLWDDKLGLEKKIYMVSKISSLSIDDEIIPKIIFLIKYSWGDEVSFIKNFKKVNTFVEKVGISTDEFWKYCVGDVTVFDKISLITDEDNFIRVKNYFFKNIYEKNDSIVNQVKNFINLVKNYDDYKDLCNDVLNNSSQLKNNYKDDILFLFNRNTVMVDFDKPHDLDECSLIRENIKNKYKKSLINVSHLNDEELKDNICKVLFNRDLKSLQKIIDIYGNVEELRKLQFNDRNDPVIVDEIEKMIVYVSFFEEIISLDDRGILEKLASNISNNLDLILDFSLQKNNLEEKYRDLYGLESERGTTKIIKGEASYYSVIDKEKTSKYGVDVYDFSRKEYCLYAHVCSKSESYEDLINGKATLDTNFISFSPISYRNQLYRDYRKNKIIFGYDNVPSDKFIMSSPKNLGSNFFLKRGNIDAHYEVVNRYQRGILETSQASYSNAETLCIREGLKPKYIILPKGKEPTSEELEIAKKYNLKFVITQPNQVSINNPEKIPQEYNELEKEDLSNINKLKELRDKLAKYSKKGKKRRIAIMTDPHALFEPTLAILEDARRNGISEIYSLGDNIGTGSNPREVLELLDKYNVQSIMGNHELYVTKGVEALREHLEQVGAYGSAKRNSDWTRKQLTSEQIKNLTLYPKAKELLIGNKKILLCHSIKDFNTGKLLYNTDDYDKVFQGHIHFKRSDGNVETVRGAGIGSENDQYDASYIILEEDGDDFKIIERNIPFDNKNLTQSINLSSLSDGEKNKIYNWVGGRR